MDREFELALVARMRAGDTSAFDAVHECYNRPLFNFLARLARRRDIAEDLLEETWLRLVSRAPALRIDTSLGPWLFTVARNLHVSYRRSRLVEDSYASGFMGLWPCGITGRSPFEMAATAEAERRIESALAALPVIYREAVLLAVEGLGSAEAAQVCGVSPEAMRQRLRRGRALLVHRFDESEVPFIAALTKAGESMKADDVDEATPLWLSHLRVIEPDPARAERVRARCRDLLVRRQQHADSVSRPDRFTAVVLQPALVIGLGLSYLLGVVYDVIRLYSHP